MKTLIYLFAFTLLMPLGTAFWSALAVTAWLALAVEFFSANVELDNGEAKPRS